MTRRWLLVWAACFGLVIAASAGGLFLVAVALDAEGRVQFAALIAAGSTLLTITAVLVFAFTGMLAHWITQTYFAPLRREAELARLMSSSNPDYRIDSASAGAREHRELALAINQLAQRNQQVLRDVESRVQEANSSLARERGHLAALLSELAQSVVVCNAEGRVLLYNEQTRQLLGGPPMQGLLGLGRSLYDVIDRETASRVYAALRERLAKGEPRPVSDFELRLCDGRRVHARMAPVRHDAGSLGERPPAEGYVLLLSASSDTVQTAPVNELQLDARPVYYDFDLFHQPGQTQDIDERPLCELAYTVFDTETTGLEPSAGDEIIAIGAVRIVNGRLLAGESYQQLIDPHRAMHPDSMRVHGITPAMLAGQPVIDAVLPTFHRFCEGTVLVGHNAAFDMRFLEMKEKSSGVRFTAPVLDTMLLSAVLHGERLEHRLDAIAERLGVNTVNRHSALGDAIATAQVFLKLIELLAAQGITTLRQARDASARTFHARIRY
jgi:DNA polymerase III epsilon subunit family exonuclease